jgi:hydrogenase-4 component E
MATALAVDGFIAGLFVMFGFGVVVVRQMLSTLYLFLLHSLALAASAVVIGIALADPSSYWVAGITVASEVIAVPLVLRFATGPSVFTRREVDQVLTIPRSLLLAGVLALIAWATADPLVHAIAGRPFAAVNLPTGLMSVSFGAMTVAVRREAVAQLMGILIMESGALFASIALVSQLWIVAEIAAAVDLPIAALVIGLLIRNIRKTAGMTRVGLLAGLKEHR